MSEIELKNEIELRKKIKAKRLKCMKKRKSTIDFKSRYLQHVYTPTSNDSLSMRILKTRIPQLKNGIINGIQVKGFIKLNKQIIKFIEDNNCIIKHDIIINK